MPSFLASPHLFPRVLSLVLGLGLAACSLAPSQSPKSPRTGGSIKASPGVPHGVSSLAPNFSAQAELPASAAGLLSLKLPARLGLALPASLVGAEGRVGLSGGDGKVGFQGSELVALADGRIVSNNSGALISDAGGNLISDAGGGIVSNNSGALISNHGGGLRHVLGTTEEVLGSKADALDDPRLHLWLVLTLIDLNDQLLTGFLAAKPVLGHWRRFSAEQVRVLPPPVLGELFTPVLKGVVQQLNALHFAGHMANEGGKPRLRVVALPTVDAPVADGYPLLDMSASGPTEAVARTRFLVDMQKLFGLDGSAARLVIQQSAEGRALVMDVADHYLPVAQRTGLGALMTGNNPMVAGRRHLILRAPKDQKHSGVMGSTSLTSPKAGLSQQDFYVGMGYAAPGAGDPGMAYFNLRRVGAVGQLGPFRWAVPFTKDDPPGSAPPAINYLNLDGQYLASPSEALKALSPSYAPGDEGIIPRALSAGEDPSQDAFLLPEALTPALLQAPISP